VLVEPPAGWPRLAEAAWTLSRGGGGRLGVYVVLGLASAMAAATARAFAWEYALGVVLAAASITGLLRRVVLPAFSFNSSDAGAIGLGLGVALAAMWSGLRLRGTPRDTGGGFGDLLSIVDPQATGRAVMVLVAIPVTASLALTRVNQFDWANILQSLVALVEATLILGVMLARQRRHDRGGWSLTAALAPPVVALTLLLLLPSATARLATATADPRVDAKAVIDRLPFIDALASFAAERLVEQPQFDVAFYGELLATETRQPVLDPEEPAATPKPTKTPKPATPKPATPEPPEDTPEPDTPEPDTPEPEVTQVPTDPP